MLNTRIIACAFAIAGTILIGSQAMAQVLPTDPGLNPYFFTLDIKDLCTTACLGASPPVPAGKRLVIQRVSGQGTLAAPDTAVMASVFISFPTGAVTQVSSSNHPI